MHGQLDIIPTTFLTGALLYLTVPKYRNDKGFVLLLAAAIACKFHVLAVVPILFLFIAKRDGWKRAMINITVTFLLVGLCIIAFWSEGFLHNVLLNNEQTVITKVTINFVNLKVFVPLLAG